MSWDFFSVRRSSFLVCFNAFLFLLIATLLWTFSLSMAIKVGCLGGLVWLFSFDYAYLNASLVTSFCVYDNRHWYIHARGRWIKAQLHNKSVVTRFVVLMFFIDMHGTVHRGLFICWPGRYDGLRRLRYILRAFY